MCTYLSADWRSGLGNPHDGYCAGLWHTSVGLVTPLIGFCFFGFFAEHEYKNPLPDVLYCFFFFYFHTVLVRCIQLMLVSLRALFWIELQNLVLVCELVNLQFNMILLPCFDTKSSLINHCRDWVKIGFNKAFSVLHFITLIFVQFTTFFFLTSFIYFMDLFYRCATLQRYIIVSHFKLNLNWQ